MIVTALLAIGPVFLGNMIFQANQQHQSVLWVLENQGMVQYASYSQRAGVDEEGEPVTASWVRNLFGDHYFDRVTAVYLGRKDITDITPLAKQKSPILHRLLA
jgi:hypothetical protein